MTAPGSVVPGAGTAVDTVVSGWSVPVSGGSSLGMLNVKGRAPAGSNLLSEEGRYGAVLKQE